MTRETVHVLATKWLMRMEIVRAMVAQLMMAQELQTVYALATKLLMRMETVDALVIQLMMALELQTVYVLRTKLMMAQARETVSAKRDGLDTCVTS